MPYTKKYCSKCRAFRNFIITYDYNRSVEICKTCGNKTKSYTDPKDYKYVTAHSKKHIWEWEKTTPEDKK